MNITIRRMRPDDVDALYRLLSDPAVMCYLEPPYDRAQAEVFLHTAGLAEPPLVYAAEENGAFLGYVIYHAYDAESVEIGWVLFPESWGRGYASALTDLLIGRGGSRRTSCSMCPGAGRPQSGSRSKRFSRLRDQRRTGGIPAMRQKSKCGEQLIRADNSQVFDRQGYLDRVLSSSYSLQRERRALCSLSGGIHAIFDRWAENGRIVIPTATVAYVGAYSAVGE